MTATKQTKVFWFFFSKKNILLAAPLLAAAGPTLFPTRDVTVAYEVTPAHQPAHEVEVAALAGATRLRITSAELPMEILVDRPAGIADLVFAPLKMYTTQRIGDADVERGILRGAAFTPGGTRTIAGLRCTVWHAASPRGTADGCLTADGVLLAGNAVSARRGPIGAVSATRVEYRPLAPDTFALPPDYREVPAEFARFTGMLK